MLTIPDLNRLKVFYVVYANKSIVRAANVLNVTRSAVSQNLKALEELDYINNIDFTLKANFKVEYELSISDITASEYIVVSVVCIPVKYDSASLFILIVDVSSLCINPLPIFVSVFSV